MSDLDTASSIAIHSATTLGGGGFGAWLMNFLKSKGEAEERKERAKLDQTIAVTLAELVKDVKEVRANQAKHDGYGERIALMERDVSELKKRRRGGGK